MRKLITLFCLIVFTSAFHLFSDDMVRMYSGVSESLWGRSENRDKVLEIAFTDFRESMSLPAAGEGFLTSVLFDGELADVILVKMDRGDSVSDSRFTFSFIDYNGKPAYRLKQDSWGLDFIFTLEKTPESILETVSGFYKNDPFNRSLVLQEYRENRVIRILRGNDVLDMDGSLNYREAMVAATIIGKHFQPFFGIHDGLGLLDNLAYLLEERAELSSDSFLTEPSELAMPESRGEYDDFVFRVKSMEGSIPENIYILAGTLCRLREGSDEYASPEEFLDRKWGGSRDFALLFYSVLEEFEYDTRLLRINPGTNLPNEYMVVYRSPGGRMWGFMGAEYWTGERFGNWTRIPALYKGRTVGYQELEGEKVLNQSRWIYPGSSKWQDSYY